jgi:hypothetical protein
MEIVFDEYLPQWNYTAKPQAAWFPVLFNPQSLRGSGNG